MIIDCHTHVNWQDHSADDAVRHMDELGVDRAWVLSWESQDAALGPGPYQYLSPEDCIQAHERHPDRLIPFCGVDPRREHAERTLREFVDRGCRGYGEIKVRLMLDHWDLIRMYEVCGELGLPVLVHIDVPLPGTGMWYGGDIDALERAAVRCPQTNFIGHGPGFWREISGTANRSKKAYPGTRVQPGGKVQKLLANHKNVYADLSANSGLNALKRDVDHARKFLTRFRKKVLYGTDIYWSEHLDFLRGLGLERAVLADILGRSAAKLTRATGG
ncbi:MAG: amidohydrolase family protein [Planctomycetota bacterium]